MIKKLSAALMAAFFLGLCLAGCSKDKGAENFVKEYYKAWGKAEMTAEKSYDDYISNMSKELLGISKEDYVKGLDNSMNGGSIKFKSAKVLGVTNYNDMIYKVKCGITVEANGESVTYNNNEYVINEEGKYKFLQYGVQSKQAVETSYSSREFSMAIDAIYIGPDTVMVNLIAKNPTTSPYAVGFGGNGRIVVETDQGSFQGVLEGSNIIKPMDENSGMQQINGVNGEIKSIAVYNVYELTASNEPKDVNNSRSYVLYNKK